MHSPLFEEQLNVFNAVWDDGEWVGWNVINKHIEDATLPHDIDSGNWGSDDTSRQKLKHHLKTKVRMAKEALARGEDVGALIGEMGERYAEARFRLKRHRKHAEGSDGKIGTDFVEVKTISPWKMEEEVRVKRKGHFGKLIIVKIDDQWMFDARIIDRTRLPKGNGGKHLKVSWTLAIQKGEE